MTVISTPLLATAGEAAEPMPTVLSAEDAAKWARAMVALHTGDALHMAMDEASNYLLNSLGYSEFVEIFHAATCGEHSPREGE